MNAKRYLVLLPKNNNYFDKHGVGVKHIVVPSTDAKKK